MQDDSDCFLTVNLFNSSQDARAFWEKLYCDCEIVSIEKDQRFEKVYVGKLRRVIKMDGNQGALF
jgi:hypothetical protein